MTVENHVDTMVFEQLGDRAHLAVHDGRIPGGEGGLVEHHDLPELPAGIQIVDYPLRQRRRIVDESRWRGVESISAGKIVVEQVRIGVEEQEVSAAVVERVIALVVD